MDRPAFTSPFSFNIFEIIIAVFLLSVLGWLVFLTISPQEQADKKRDKLLRDEAQSFVEAERKYFEKEGSWPWEGEALPWTASSDPKVGVDLLVAQQFLPGGSGSREIFVGKGEKKETSVFACFAPKSKAEKVDLLKLNSLEPGKPLSFDGEPAECLEQPNWQTSFCYVCVWK